MKEIKRYYLSAAVILLALALVLLRSSGDHFRSDAVKLAEPSLEGKYIITPAELEAIADKFVIDLGGGLLSGSKALSPEEILFKDNLRTIRKHKGKVILDSSDPSVSARIWMILSQLGVKDLLILVPENGVETLRNEIRPDIFDRPDQN